jgi:hypothetical protein
MTRREDARVIHILAGNLTRRLRCRRSQRAAGRGSSQGRTQRTGGLCLLLGLLMLQMQPVHATDTTSTDHYKLYAHSRIVDFEQYTCFVKLINKENRHWNPSAKNGSHYGIGQMRNTNYKKLDGYTQIDWTLRYIKGRYLTPCKAWAFFQANGYH